MADTNDKLAALRDVFGEGLTRARVSADRKRLIKVACQAGSLIQIGEDAKPKMEEIQESQEIITALLCDGIDSSEVADISISATMVTAGSHDPTYRAEVIAGMAAEVPAREGREIALAVALATALVDGDLDKVETSILGELAVGFDIDEERLGALIEQVARAVARPEKEEKLEALAEQSADKFVGSQPDVVFDALARAGTLMAMAGERHESTQELPLLRAMLAGIAEMDPDIVGRKCWDTMVECSKMSRDEILNSICTALPHGEPRQTCLALAAAICLVDGKLDDDEAKVYDSLVRRLEVEPDIAAEILRATAEQLSAS